MPAKRSFPRPPKSQFLSLFSLQEVWSGTTDDLVDVEVSVACIAPLELPVLKDRCLSNPAYPEPEDGVEAALP